MMVQSYMTHEQKNSPSDDGGDDYDGDSSYNPAQK